MDIAKLGIAVDSEDLQSGSTELETFAGAAKKAEASVNDFEGSVASQSAATRAANEVQSKYSVTIQRLETRLKQISKTREFDTNSISRAKKEIEGLNKELLKDSKSIESTRKSLLEKNIQEAQSYVNSSDIKIDAIKKEIAAQRQLSLSGEELIDAQEALGEVSKKGVDLSLASIAKLAASVGIVEFAIGAAFNFLVSLREEVVEFEEAIDDLEGSITASTRAAELNASTYEDLQTVYGGNEQAVKNYTAALQKLREEQALEALSVTLNAIKQEEAFKRVDRALNADLGTSGAGRALSLQMLNRELGITEGQAVETIRRLDELGKTTSFEEAAKKAAEFREWLTLTDSELSDAILPTLIEFEGAARSAFAEASDGAKELQKSADRAANALAGINRIRDNARDQANSARGDKRAVIEAELQAETAALRALAVEAVKNGANRIETAKSTYQAIAALADEAQSKILKLEADTQKKRDRIIETENKARLRAIDAIAKKTDKYISSQLKGSNQQIRLIQRRLKAEHDALDELAAEAIAKGADEIEINNSVAEAKRQAMAAANIEIYRFEAKLKEKRDRDDQKAQDKRDRAARRRADEEARTKDRIRRFDQALNRDGIKTGSNIDNHPLGDTVKKFGTSRQLGRQSPESQLSELLFQQEEMMLELDRLEEERLSQVGNNREAQLEIEQDFADRRSAIQEEMLERQKDVMARASDLALGDAENLFGSLADAAATAFGKQSAAARAFLVAEQGIMIARASMALGPALMNALAAPFPINLAQFATVAALGAQIIGNISNISTAIGGRRQGGFTAKDMLYEVNEGGMPEVFQSGNKRYLLPGQDGNVVPESRLPRAGNDNRGSGNINIKMIDRAGVKMTARQMNDGEIELLIEERANAIVDSKVPKLVSGQLRKPNSKIAQAMGQNFKAPRNRP